MKHLICRIILAIAAIAAASLPAAAAKPAPTAAADTLTAADVFLELPVNVLDIVPRSARFEMLEYYKVDSIYKAPNAMEGLSWLNSVEPDFLEVQITDVSTLQLRLLPLAKGGRLIMTLYTVGGDSQAADTDIRFFDPQMNEMPRDKYFKLPHLKEFFNLKGAITSVKELETMIPFPTVHYTASAGSTDLKAELTVGEFMNQDDYRIIKVLLKPDGLTYVWDGKQFRLKK